ncbi:MAG: fatty acid metabolism transcriptional regulator FadR [Chloroflexota bacterium]|nr:fatty acid metabolism transcriptional regulator FadR [Chloroflexota bacterium]
MTTYQSKQQKESWTPVRKPAEIVESRLIEGILNGTFQPDSHLPGERELSESLGVTRPTLREALQRLARDGWVEIHQGKPTRVCNYLQEGNLGVLNALSERPEHLPEDFVSDLLSARLAMAPMYTAQAIKRAPDALLNVLEEREVLHDSPESFAQFDWRLHHQLTILSGNPVFVMILNGFKDLYLNLAPAYFAITEARQHSQFFYEELVKATKNEDAYRAQTLTESIMRDSLTFWEQTELA